MSNLKLPNMNWAKLQESKKATLGYKTTALYNEDYNSLGIYHHDNMIAVLGEEEIYLTNSGWISSTTTNRLHKILTDNVGGGWRINIQQGRQVLTNSTGGKYFGNSFLFTYNFRYGWVLRTIDGLSPNV